MLADLRWYKLPVTLMNIRTSSSMKAEPFSIMQAIMKGVTTPLVQDEDPTIFFQLTGKRHTFRFREGERFLVNIFFCRYPPEFIKQWKNAFVDYLADPVSGRNFEIFSLGEIEERSLEKISEGISPMKTEGELCLEFLTPFPFKTEKGKRRTYLSNENFIKSFERRLSYLFGKQISYQSKEDNFSILPYYWKYTELRHPSHSQPGSIQYLNGCVGKLYLKGSFKNILPFLLLGSELHTGKKVSNSQGYFILHKDSSGYFERFFPDKRAISPVIQDVLQRYDHALESLSITEKNPFNENDFAESLEKQIKEDTYLPSPNTGFIIKKKNNAERLVEQLNYKDLIVQQYLKKTIEDVFERMFEEESIGFRKGISREKAIEMVRSAINERYCFLIESDIEDFFPSVDLNKLGERLEDCLPQKDACLRGILLKSIKNGYTLNGIFHERVRGIAQGSPLSPLLANLYLDSFDEEIKELDVRMIRYADDFIILTRTRESAQEILSKSEIFLSGLGLKIKKEKTAIKPISEGFQFLGIRFERSEVRVEPEEEFKRFKKPLYITEPYLFLALNGDAVDVKRNKAVIETIPLRRISEIMMMDKTVFSTALIAKCTENNIPVSITMNSGYYINTIKPDSKSYYDLSFQHGNKYYSLSETEVLCMAKEFAAGKINNYLSLFKQRYKKGENVFLKEIESAINQIYAAADINQIRGIEGAAAKKVYNELNILIDEPVFCLKKRERKNPDCINSLLNYGYYLLFSRINITVRAVGLNPYLGFLHSPLDNYESLVCDIEELFRARIDRFIIRLINLKSITRNDFIETEKGMFLKREAVKGFLNHFEAEMEKKKGDTSLSLNEEIYVQVKIIKKWVVENSSLSFYKWMV